MEENQITKTQIKFIENGPIKVVGPLMITKPDGTIVEKEIASFCRCGASANMPFCDASHKTLHSKE